MTRRIVCACILFWGLTAHAQSPQQDPDTQLDILLQELDTLNESRTAQERQIQALKARLQAIEDEGAAREREGEAGLRARLDAVEAELRRQREAESRSRAGRPAGTRRIVLVPDFEFRIRGIGETNRWDLDGRRGDSDVFVQHRLRVGMTLGYGSNVAGVVVLQDAREWAEGRSATSDQQSLDLFEGYLRITDIGRTGVDVRAGRMRMAFGAGRQVSARQSNAVGQVFEGVRLTWSRPRVIAVDAFATLVRTGVAPVFQSGRGQDRYSVFSGIHLRVDSWAPLDAEAYALYLDDAFNEATEKIGTVGARLVARPVRGLTFEAEGAVQFGRVEVRDLGARRLDASHLAGMFFGRAAYRFQVPTSPTLAVNALYASGDADPFNNRNRAYRPGFNSRHNVFGVLDLFTWQGVWDIAPSFSITPVPELELTVATHLFSLSSDGGFVKAFGTEPAWRGDDRPAGLTYRHVVFPSGGPRFLGQEVDLLVTWHATDWLMLNFEYGFFVPQTRVTSAQVLSVGEVSDPGAGMTRDGWQRDGLFGESWAHRGYLEATVTF